MDEYTLEVHDQPDDIHWNDRIASLPGVHILQTKHWAEIKARVGWKAEYLVWKDQNGCDRSAALVLLKTVPIIGRFLKTCVIYIPRGPMLDWSDSILASRVLHDLIDFGKRKNAIFLKIDPDLPITLGLPGSESFHAEAAGQLIVDKLKGDDWCYSSDQIQFKNTITLDLKLSENELLNRMKQKTRYNITLAGRKGVTVRPGNPADFSLLYKMYAQTALRDGFAIRDEEYYQYVWKMLFNADMAMPLIAEVDGVPVSAIILFLFAKKAYYFYGMSTGEQREKMPNHILQWEAIRYAKAVGCAVYDFWGAPDIFNDRDPMWGVFRFKDGFNGTVVSGIGAWDYVLKPGLFKVYSEIMPEILNIMRRIGRKRISDEVSK